MILVSGWLGGLRRDLLAFHLLLDGLENPIAHGVVVLLGVELVGGRLLDELPRQRQLGVLHRHVLDRDVGRAPKLGG